MQDSHAAKIYRERAEQCFRLAIKAGDAPIRDTLESLGYDMLAVAEEFEPTAAAGPAKKPLS